MKHFHRFSFLFLVAFLISIHIHAQVDNPPAELKEAPAARALDNPEKAAEKIEQYWFVMLKTGPKQNIDSLVRNKLFAGHMDNIKRLYNAGILKVAGPFGANEFKWRGIFVLDCRTKKEAEDAVSTDPAVKAGLLEAEIVPWYTEPSGNFAHGKPDKLID